MIVFSSIMSAQVATPLSDGFHRELRLKLPLNSNYMGLFHVILGREVVELKPLIAWSKVLRILIVPFIVKLSIF